LETAEIKNNGADLDLLFRPRSLAVIGISRELTRGGGFIWWKINHQGYIGKKYPISRSCDQLDGNPCYRSVAEVEEPIDLAIAAIPAAGVLTMLEDCARKGIRFVVIHAAGFAELGEEGRALQEKVLAAGRKHGIRLVGPNCMGIFCPEVRLNTIVEVEEEDVQPGNVAFCGQSGWATENFVAGGCARGLRFSTVISSGNQADLNLLDYLSYFSGDPATRVICAYAEGISQGRKFLSIASEAANKKPVIIWKAGFSPAGSQAALSHSGSITGNKGAWTGAARSAGIFAAEGFEDLQDLAVTFSSPPFPKGKKVGIMAEAGGGGISASDACEQFGMEVSPFSPHLRTELTLFLKDHLPPFSGTGNPLDLVWLPSHSALTICTRCIELIAPEVDSLILMAYQPFVMPEMRAGYIEAFCRLRDHFHLPIYIVPPYPARSAEAMKAFTVAGLPAFSSFERAARAAAAASQWQARSAPGYPVESAGLQP
jgi:acetate---CoA ligase (ADP-forming)